MKSRISNLSPELRLVLLVPILALAYSIVRIVIPAVVNAVVPEVVRNVLHMI